MQANRSRDTGPEIQLRSALHRAGLRFRKHFRIPGTRTSCDVAFPKQRVAVFLDGCFWHDCPVHGHVPKTNAEYWGRKLERNRARDEATNALLISLGWVPVRVWEHETPFITAVERVTAQLRWKRIDRKVEDWP